MLAGRLDGDDERHMPAVRCDAKEPQGIVRSVQGSDLDGKAEDFASVVEGSQGVNGVVAVAVGYRDDKGKLARVAKAVGGEFVDAVAVYPALAVAVPTPEGQGVAIGTVAVTVLLGFLASVVAVAELLTARVGPGGEFASIAGDVEVLQVDQVEVDRARDEASVEDWLEDTLIGGKCGEVAFSLQDGCQVGRLEIAGLDAIRQAVDDVHVGTEVILVLMVVGLVAPASATASG